MGDTTNSKWGWHFLQPNRKLGYMDHRKVELGVRMEMQYRSIETGRLIKTRQVPRLCLRGMHASEYILDALRYPFNLKNLVLCRVLVEEDLVISDDKFAGRYRTVTGWTEFEDIAKKVLIDFATERDKGVADSLTKFFDTGAGIHPGVDDSPVVWQLASDVMNHGPALALQQLGHAVPESRAWIENRIVHYAKETGIVVE